jgi:hypothetical protein
MCARAGQSEEVLPQDQVCVKQEEPEVLPYQPIFLHLTLVV